MIKTLYSRRSDGKLQQWSIEVDGPYYRTISGIKDGELVTSEWTTVEAKNIGKKNFINQHDQALKEATAKFEKKKASGYSEEIGGVDEQKFFEPMLAKKYEDYKAKIRFPCYSQPKLDGCRFVVQRGVGLSRNGKPLVSTPHILKALEEFSGDVFDGELYSHDLNRDFNKIISLVRQQKPTAQDFEDSKEHVQYWIYDYPSRKGTFSERFEALCRLKIVPECIKIVPTDKCYSFEDLDRLYERYMADGYEGQIIRIDAPYENKRSQFLLKRKEFMDEEFTIVDVVEGEGNRSGMAGYLVLKIDRLTIQHGRVLGSDDRPGSTFRSNIKGGFDFYRQLLKEKQSVIGKKATIKFFQYTPDGIPRFPVCVGIRDYE